MGRRRVSPSRLLAVTLVMCVAASVPALASSASSAAEGDNAEATTGAAAGQDPVTGTEKALRYQGGRVLLDPRVHVVFWGSEWGAPDAKGMPTADPLGVAPVVVDFFARLGGKGDTWSTILTQYCSGTKVNHTSCGPGSRKIPRLSRSPLRGWWVDTTPGPSQSNLDNQMGAWDDVTQRALNHFGAKHQDDIVVLMLPPGTQSAQCGAFHSVAETAQGLRPVIGIRYPTPGCPNALPPTCPVAQPVECLPTAEIAITGSASHEYAEVVTDPFPMNCAGTSHICGWVLKDAEAWGGGADPRTYEISDACSNYRFVQLNGKKVRVATLWSNSANKGRGGCVGKYVNDGDQS